MDDELKEFKNAVELEQHILADLNGTDLPKEVENHLFKISEAFKQDKDNLGDALRDLEEGYFATGYIEFRKFVENFPSESIKELYSYCKTYQILSTKQLKELKSSIKVFEKDASDLERKLWRYSLEIGKEKVLESKNCVYIEEKAVKKAYSLVKTYQLKRDIECAGVFKREPGQKNYLKDFRGLNIEEGDYKEGEVSYSDSFRAELEDVQNNGYVLMHSHPQIGSEMGSVAYRPSNADLKFFRNHRSQISIICPLLPNTFDETASMSAISLTKEGFDFLPIRVVNSGETVTTNYPSIQLYNNIVYLMSVARLEGQRKDAAIGTIQFMLGEDTLKKLC